MERRGRKRKHGLPVSVPNIWREKYLALHSGLYRKVIAMFKQKREAELRQLNSLETINFIQPRIVQLTTQMFIFDVAFPIKYLIQHLNNFRHGRTQLCLYDSITDICVEIGTRGDLRTFGARTFPDAYYACLLACAKIKPIYNKWLRENRKETKSKFRVSDIQVTGIYAVIDTRYPLHLSQLAVDLDNEEKSGKCSIRNHLLDQFTYELETKQKQFTYKYYLESRKIQEQEREKREREREREQSKGEGKEAKSKKKSKKLTLTITCHLLSTGKVLILGAKNSAEINEVWRFFAVLLSNYQLNMIRHEFPSPTSLPNLTPSSLNEKSDIKSEIRSSLNEKSDIKTEIRELSDLLEPPDIPLTNLTNFTLFEGEEIGDTFICCYFCSEFHQDGQCKFLKDDEAEDEPDAFPSDSLGLEENNFGTDTDYLML